MVLFIMYFLVLGRIIDIFCGRGIFSYLFETRMKTEGVEFNHPPPQVPLDASGGAKPLVHLYLILKSTYCPILFFLLYHYTGQWLFLHYKGL